MLVVLLNEVAAPGKLPQIAELPAGITAGQLLTDGLLGPDVEAGAVRLLVNNEEVQDAGQLLCHGDQVSMGIGLIRPMPLVCPAYRIYITECWSNPGY